MTLQLNGEPRTFDELRTIADLVKRFEFPAPTVLIEHNGSALRREEWPATPLADGDRIEVLRIAAGG